jgi:RND superfamily putative drug exporter
VVDVIVADTTSLTTTMDLVGRIRALRDSIDGKDGIRGLRGARLLVGGYAAENVDFQDDLLRRFPLLIALVLGTTSAMLAVIFRSVLIPLKAILLNSASVAATFGIIVLAFQDGLGAGLLGLDGPAAAIFVVVPVSVFATVFGLSMDYEVFLLARIKEEYELLRLRARAAHAVPRPRPGGGRGARRHRRPDPARAGDHEPGGALELVAGPPVSRRT